MAESLPLQMLYHTSSDRTNHPYLRQAHHAGAIWAQRYPTPGAMLGSNLLQSANYGVDYVECARMGRVLSVGRKLQVGSTHTHMGNVLRR